MSLNNANKFLEGQKTCVIASIDSDGKPEAAAIGFYHDPANSYKILIGTNKASRKYANLKNNPNVAMVMGINGAQTVQIEGTAEEVSVSLIAAQLDAYFTKSPTARKFAEVQSQTYFLITPNWLRHTNYQEDQPIFETKDFS